LFGKRGAFLNGHVLQFKRHGRATKIHQSGAKSVNRRVFHNGRGTLPLHATPPFPTASRVDFTFGHKVAGGVKKKQEFAAVWAEKKLEEKTEKYAGNLAKVCKLFKRALHGLSMFETCDLAFGMRLAGC